MRQGGHKIMGLPDPPSAWRTGLREPASEACRDVQRGTLLPYRPISAALAIAPSVSVVIPAVNEAKNIPHVFATLPVWVDEVVLVDGRSTDGTIAVAKQIRPDVKVVMQPGMGKGDALVAGFAAC